MDSTGSKDVLLRNDKGLQAENQGEAHTPYDNQSPIESTSSSPLLQHYDKPTYGSRADNEEVLKKTQSKPSSRHPFLINAHVIHGTTAHDHINTLAQYNRYRYYTKLHGHQERIVIPDHVLPSYLFLPSFVSKAIEANKQSSLITIFAIWNTMMGTSLLSLPWAVTQSGLGLGIGIILGMGVICLYTCLLIMRSAKTMDDSAKHEAFEFSDVCHRYLGKVGKLTSIVFSIIALLGAAVVYWVLLSNFLYSTGKFIFDNVNSLPRSSHNVSSSNYTINVAGVLCTNGPLRADRPSVVLTPSDNGVFFHLWKKRMTVPFFLLVVLYPLSCLKSPTFFTKFNAMGTLSVFFMLIFVCVKAGSWGIRLYGNTSTEGRIFLVNWSSWQFPSLSGTLGLALYIHNCILSITRNQAKPENNTRDVCIAYFLATGTYLFMGVMFYLSFPLAKSCIEQVLLDNFPSSDVLTFTAQVFLLFQMVTVYPLLLYIIRVQLLTLLFGKVFPGWLHVLFLNAVVIALGISFAVFYPHVGHIIRYVGSVSALIYIFGLPCIIHMVILYRKDRLTWPKVCLFSGLVFIGIVNLILQFFV